MPSLTGGVGFTVSYEITSEMVRLSIYRCGYVSRIGQRNPRGNSKGLSEEVFHVMRLDVVDTPANQSVLNRVSFFKRLLFVIRFESMLTTCPERLSSFQLSSVCK